jgi:hypothetical protein
MVSELRGTSSGSRTLDERQVAALRPATRRRRRHRAGPAAAAPVETITPLPGLWEAALAACREGEKPVARSPTQVDIVRVQAN